MDEYYVWVDQRNTNNGHTAQLLYISQLDRKVAIIYFLIVRLSKGLHKAISICITKALLLILTVMYKHQL